MTQNGFGPLAAEKDSNLLDYFHMTEFALRLVAAPPGEAPFLMLSRPGAGKTALKRWLLSDQAPGMAIPFDASNGRVFVEEDTDLTDDDYSVLLRAELGVALLGALNDRAPKIPAKKSRTLEQQSLADTYARAKDCLENTYWRAVKGFFDRLAGFSVLGSGLQLHKKDRQKYLDTIRRSGVADTAVDVIAALAEHHPDPLRLVVDNPENVVGRGSDLTSRENAIRLGALLDALSEIHARGLNVTAFTKYHVFEAVRDHYIDFSHFANGVGRLEWTADDLVGLVKLRIEKRMGSTWKKTLGFSENEFRDVVLPVLVNGPRDLLFLLGRARGNAVAKMGLDDLMGATPDLREEKFQDMTRLFGERYDGIRAVCKALVDVASSLDSPFSFERLEAAVKTDLSDAKAGRLYPLRSKYDWIIDVPLGAPRATDLLSQLGALSYEVDGDEVFPWRGRPHSEIARRRLSLTPLFH